MARPQGHGGEFARWGGADQCAARLGMTRQALWIRVRRTGWTPEQAVTTLRHAHAPLPQPEAERLAAELERAWVTQQTTHPLGPVVASELRELREAIARLGPQAPQDTAALDALRAELARGDRARIAAEQRNEQLSAELAEARAKFADLAREAAKLREQRDNAIAAARRGRAA